MIDGYLRWQGILPMLFGAAILLAGVRRVRGAGPSDDLRRRGRRSVKIGLTLVGVGILQLSWLDADRKPYTVLSSLAGPWEDAVLPAGGFIVTLPAPRDTRDPPVDVIEGFGPVHGVWTATAERALFTAVAIQVPPARRQPAGRRAVAPPDAQKSRTFQLDECAGVEYECERKDDREIGRTIDGGDRVYHLWVTVPHDRPIPRDAAARFFASFQVLR